MLLWIEREYAQKHAPAAGNSAGTGAPEALRCARHIKPVLADTRTPSSVHSGDAVGLPSTKAKTVSTLAAKFALAGRELHTIAKEGRTYFEVRRWDQCYTCSTLADLRGLLARCEAAP